MHPALRKRTPMSLTAPLLSCLRVSAVPKLLSIVRPEEAAAYRPLPKPEDPPQLQAHQRMEEIAQRPERQPVLHGVLDDSPFFSIVKPVGVPPEPVGTAHLLVHEPVGWLPVHDACLPAQRNTEKAQSVVDCGPFFHWDRLWCEDLEVQFRRCNALQVGSIREKGEHLFAWQRQLHGRLENMEGHITYCERNGWSL